MGKKSIKIGGDAKNVVNVVGDSNVVRANQTLTQVTLPAPDTVNIAEVIAALKEELDKLLLNRKDSDELAQAIGRIEEEAKGDEPDKLTIGDGLEKALELAEKAGNFAERAGKIGSHVIKAASWLGENWYKLLPLVGLAAG